MAHKISDLQLLDKNKLIDIIITLQSRLLKSRKGQPQRDNLIGETFSALTVVADAGNQQGHSTWHCRCSGNIYNSLITGICDRTSVVWGSNLKSGRKEYCGDPSCPAARQILGRRRRKDLFLGEGFKEWMKAEIKFVHALLGESLEENDLVDMYWLQEYNNLCTVLSQFYGLGDDQKAFKIEEIGESLQLARPEMTALKKRLDYYVDNYQQFVKEGKKI